MIIGLTGKAGAGKDTVGDMLVKHYGFRKDAFAATLKAMLATAGMPEPKAMLATAGMPEPKVTADKEKSIEGFDFSWRQAAQTLGTEWGRSLDPDLWVKLTMNRVLHWPGHCVFTDVRFENEAAAIRRVGGHIWHVAGRQTNLGAHAGHASEAGVQFYPNKDFLINNGYDLQMLFDSVATLVGAMHREASFGKDR
jgi:hypothetical protein